MSKLVYAMSMLIMMLLVAVSSYTIVVKAEDPINIYGIDWRADNYAVGYWENTPKAYYSDLSSSFSVRNHFLSAISAWNTKGIPSTVTTTPTNANIMFYAGTKAQLNTIGFYYDTNDYGLTYNYYNEVGTVNSYLYKLHRFESSLASTSYESTAIEISEDNIKDCSNRVTVHEFGHSLGWIGHSAYSTDVMYPYINSDNAVLTTGDGSFLKQVYDAVESYGE